MRRPHVAAREAAPVTNTFEHLIILGRPASGKSEFIDYIKKLPDAERVEKFHIGQFEEIDDFPWIWAKFMDDNIWEAAGYKRLYSFADQSNPGLKEDAGLLFDYCIERFNFEISEKYLQNREFYVKKTLIIEFSRGGEKAYQNALQRLKRAILKKAAIFYIKVSAEESWRRNVARYEEKLRHSILAHMVPKRTFDAFYKTDDWSAYTNGEECGMININGLDVPFVTMNNEPELPPGPEIAKRYKEALDKLFRLLNEK